jgi:hypothetical protein
MIVEKNDVDISPLFSWSKKFEIVDKDDKVLMEIFMRIVGDADLNRTRVFALRNSADLRNKLKDENSDEHLAYLPHIDQMSEEQLINLILVLSMRDISKKVVKNVKVKVPKVPRSDASTEKQEKYQLEVDAYEGKRQVAIKKDIEKELELKKEDLLKQTKDQLYNAYVIYMINELCEQEVMRCFREYSAYLGSYKDENLRERLFASFEDFANLPTNLKEQFISAYQSLDLGGDNLKKLLQATQ